MSWTIIAFSISLYVWNTVSAAFMSQLLITCSLLVFGVRSTNFWPMKQRELAENMAMAEETERKMIEVSALNSLFSDYVLRQAQQIEKIYVQVLSFSFTRFLFY